MSRTGIVQSVDRALHLLEALALRNEGARLSELAREVELPPSTAHRLLTTLEQRGFAQFDQGLSQWHVGRRAFTVGMAFSQWQNLVAAAMPYLRSLRDATRETANLGVLEEGEVITVAQVESREIIRAISPPGGRAPVMNSGMGKAIIATWRDDEIEALVTRHGLRPMTRHSIGSMSQVRAEIAQIRQQGYALDDEEFTSGMRCIAAVIWSATGEAIGAISVSALASRLPPEAVPAAGERIKDLAQRLTLALGGHDPRQPGIIGP